MLEDPWTLSPTVALRLESFGAMAYHFGNRKLTFLKSPELVMVVRGLDQHPHVAAALDAAGVPSSQRDAYVAALRGLAESDMIRPREESLR
jgi:putative mycofactocin binding protein MftB